MRRQGNPETELQRAIMTALAQLGVWAIRTAVIAKRSAVGAATGEDGLPDLYLPGLGHLEVKLEDGATRPAQLEWHERARRVGIRTAFVRSVRDAVRVVEDWLSLTPSYRRFSGSRTGRAETAHGAQPRKRRTPTVAAAPDSHLLLVAFRAKRY